MISASFLFWDCQMSLPTQHQCHHHLPVSQWLLFWSRELFLALKCPGKQISEGVCGTINQTVNICSHRVSGAVLVASAMMTSCLFLDRNCFSFCSNFNKFGYTYLFDMWCTIHTDTQCCTFNWLQCLLFWLLCEVTLSLS